MNPEIRHYRPLGFVLGPDFPAWLVAEKTYRGAVQPGHRLIRIYREGTEGESYMVPRNVLIESWEA